MSIPLSIISLTRATVFSFFNQRDPVQADPTPSTLANSLPVMLIYLFLVLPGYLIAWALLTAHARGYVIPLVGIVIAISGGIYRFLHNRYLVYQYYND